MKKNILIFTTLIFLNACAANVIVRKMPDTAERMRVAVLPIKPHTSFPQSSELAYEAFSTHILEVKGYDVVDRGALDQLIKEQKLGQSGTIDHDKAVEIGKLLGAGGIILGSVTEYVQRKNLMFPPAKVSINARLINTRTGEVEWTASHTGGGMNRWFTWLIWPYGVYSTIASPSAEDQVRNTSRKIFRTLEKKFSAPNLQGSK
ncbi:MAG: DUF799 family lipoprotein [Elusimicrobiales bacterium]|nr:DUF799 family lipoprotein [Elusimicrobiales bacterium]MCK5357286.1 DUF799 family lipoprotein [Elusimicrobiales bacterium]